MKRLPQAGWLQRRNHTLAPSIGMISGAAVLHIEYQKLAFRNRPRDERPFVMKPE